LSQQTTWEEIDRRAAEAGLKRESTYTFDRTFRAHEIHVPEQIELVRSGDCLTLEVVELWEGRWRTPARGLLPAFARMANAQPEEILDFTSRWGLLGLCEHGVPSSHNPPPLRGGGHSGERTWCYPTEQERIEDWRHFSSQARALLAIAVRVYRRKPGHPADWRTVYARSPSPEEAPWWERTPNADARMLGLVIEEWLYLANIRPQFRWSEEVGGFGFDLGAPGLFAHLARELAFTVARFDGLAVCSGCGYPYVPERRPRQDRLNFCSTCQDRGVPARLRKRKERARDAESPKGS
jgi:hypothetical protein